MNRFQKSLAACFGTLLTFGTLPFAQAAFHLWKIDEVYSNASGSVQFIELSASTNGGQQFVNGQTLKSNGHTFSFTANLPSDTTNKHFLLATPGYFALTGVPTADYNLGVNNFFNVNGDTINYAGGINTLAFTAGQLPTNGLNSLNRDYNAGPTTFTVGSNSPTDFTGTAGSVIKPGDVNLDGHVDANDISAMTSALVNPSGYSSSKSITTSQLATVGDVNQDSAFNNADLQALLTKLNAGGGSATTVPEPSSYLLAALVGGLLWKSRRRFKID
jgi:hypothetical protein